MTPRIRPLLAAALVAGFAAFQLGAKAAPRSASPSRVDRAGTKVDLGPPRSAMRNSADREAGFVSTLAPVQLVETRPVEYAIGNPELPEALPTWLAMFKEARHTIDVEQFYLSTWPGEPMDAVLRELGDAAHRGVKIRLILDAGMYRTYPHTADSLGMAENWEVRLVDFKRIAGGIQHSKFFLIDTDACFEGSQNFDWRALKHIHELGVAVHDPRVTRDFQQVFDMDWAAATPVGEKPDTTHTVFMPPPRMPALALPYRIAQAPGDTLELWPSFTPGRFIPDTTMWDLRRIVGLIDGARHEVVVQVLQYSPESRGEKLPDLDNALRRAAGRGVQVKMVVSDWEMGGRGLAFLQDLAKVPNVQVKLSTVPEWSGGYIPFARVEHCKYMVVDTLMTWVGTDNWEPGYFTGTRNLAVTVKQRAFARQARTIFENSWKASGAQALDAEAKYPAKAHGEDAPAGKKKYGG